MRVDWAIPCRLVEVHDGLATIVGGGIDQYVLPAVPGQMLVNIALRLVGLLDQAQHQLRIRILDPVMAEAAQALDTTFTMNPPGPNHPPGWEGHVVLPMVLRFEALVEGTYTVDIVVDGHSHTVPLMVQTPAQTAGPPPSP